MARVGRPRRGERAPVDQSLILDRAATIFAQSGYHATSLMAVADDLGVTRQALYHYFPSKQDILAALFTRATTLLEDSANAATEGDPGTRLRRMLSGHNRLVFEYGDLFILLTTERAEFDALPGIGDWRTTYGDRFIAAYEDGVTAGTLRPVSDVATVVTTLMGAPGSLLFWHEDRTTADPEVLTAAVTDLALHGIER
jgi:AcrR family transcriptional regulator